MLSANSIPLTAHLFIVRRFQKLGIDNADDAVADAASKYSEPTFFTHLLVSFPMDQKFSTCCARNESLPVSCVLLPNTMIHFDESTGIVHHHTKLVPERVQSVNFAKEGQILNPTCTSHL